MEPKFNFIGKNGMGNGAYHETVTQVKIRRRSSLSILMSGLLNKSVEATATSMNSTSGMEGASDYEVRAMNALADLEDAQKMWKKDSGFKRGLKRIGLRRRKLDYWGQKVDLYKREKQYRLSGKNGNWKNYADPVQGAENVDITTAITLLKGFIKAKKKPDSKVVVVCEHVARREKSKIMRFRDSIDASYLLERHLLLSVRESWRKVFDSMVENLPSGLGRYERRVLHITSAMMDKALAIHKQSRLRFAQLLENDKKTRYKVASSAENAGAPKIKELDNTMIAAQKSFKLAEAMSEAAGLPVVLWCNARGGTVFGLTVDSPETQIDRQLDSASRIQFWKEVGKSTSGLNRKSNRDSQAIMRVATRWMKQPNSNIKKLVITVLNAKIPSTGDRRRAHFWEISLVARQAMRLGNPVMFLDSSPKHQGRSSERLGNKFGFLGSHRFRHQEGFDMKNINALKKSKNKMLVLSVNPQTTQDKHWSDDNPHFLGQRVKKFSKDKNETLDVVIAEPDGHIVFLSEKIEFTMKVRDVDSNGAHWFSRNFRGYVMRNHPQTHPDSPEYRRLYHEWVPFETNHVNAPIFDKHGYVIIKETATLAHFPKGYVSGRLAFQALIKRA